MSWVERAPAGGPFWVPPKPKYGAQAYRCVLCRVRRRGRFRFQVDATPTGAAKMREHLIKVHGLNNGAAYNT